MSYSGYDIEDAIILNKASLDRGFGRVSVYRRVKTEFKTTLGVMDSLKAPENNKHSKQRVIDASGLAKVGERLINN
jgi:DNA-directed RNA polymerase III subunit RPC2